MTGPVKVHAGVICVLLLRVIVRYIHVSLRPFLYHELMNLERRLLWCMLRVCFYQVKTRKCPRDVDELAKLWTRRLFRRQRSEFEPQAEVLLRFFVFFCLILLFLAFLVVLLSQTDTHLICFRFVHLFWTIHWDLIEIILTLTWVYRAGESHLNTLVCDVACAMVWHAVSMHG